MFGISPLFLVTTILFSMSAHADSARPQRDLKWICDPTGNADLKRLEIRETDLKGQLYFREVYQNEESLDHKEFYFDWISISTNKMPKISQDRAVERTVGGDNAPRWTIGGKPAVCVDAHLYNGLAPKENAPEDLMVECDTPFLDLIKVEIREQMDLAGSYYLVEYFSDGRVNTIYDFFGSETLKPEELKTQAEIEKFAFPKLTDWNGYKRTLHRSSNTAWYMETRDECSGSWHSISCKTYLY